jgi:hypothetical protein
MSGRECKPHRALSRIGFDAKFDIAFDNRDGGRAWSMGAGKKN